MAEIAGLVLSGIALTSLFKTCVEFVEYFEDSRDWVFDFGLALTKVGLLKARLDKLERTIAQSSWESMQDAEGLHCAGLPHHQASQAITHGLKGVDDILERASKLCRRYSTDSQSRPTKQCHIQSPGIDHFLNDTGEGNRDLRSVGTRERPGLRLTYRTAWVILGRKATWAVYDKRKFDSLISDFDFFLSNLETVAHFSSVPASAAETISSQETRNLHTFWSELTPQGTIGAQPTQIKMPSKPTNTSNNELTPPPSPNSGERRTEGLPASSSVKSQAKTMSTQATSTGSKYTKNEVEGRAIAICGDARGPFAGEEGNYYLENKIRENAFVHAGRNTEVMVKSLQETWLASIQGGQKK